MYSVVPLDKREKTLYIGALFVKQNVMRSLSYDTTRNS